MSPAQDLPAMSQDDALLPRMPNSSYWHHFQQRTEPKVRQNEELISPQHPFQGSCSSRISCLFIAIVL